MVLWLCSRRNKLSRLCAALGHKVLVFIFGGLCVKDAVQLRIRLLSLPLFQDEKTVTTCNVSNLVDAY